MEYLPLSLLLVATHASLYPMDDDAIKKLATCTQKCIKNYEFETQCGSRIDPEQRAEICADHCNTWYKCEAKRELYKERTQALLAQIQAQQTNKN
jgi:hypothetical protein